MDQDYVSHHDDESTHAMSLANWRPMGLPEVNDLAPPQQPPLSPNFFANYVTFPDESNDVPAYSYAHQHPFAPHDYGWTNFGHDQVGPASTLSKTLKRKPATIGTLSQAFDGLVAPAAIMGGMQEAGPSRSPEPQQGQAKARRLSLAQMDGHREAMAVAQAQPIAHGMPGFTLSPLTAKPVTYFSYAGNTEASFQAPPLATSTTLAQSWSNSGGARRASMASEPYPAKQIQPAHPERPFKCDECPQSFNRGHDLKRHKRIHLVVKPFPCGWCERTFSRKDALKRHLLVKGCGAGLGQTQEDSERGISRAPSLRSGAMAEMRAELMASTSRSPSSTEEMGSPESVISHSPSSPSSPALVPRAFPGHGRRRSAPTYLAMPPPLNPNAIFAKKERVSPTQLLATAAPPPSYDHSKPPPTRRPRVQSADSYTDSVVSNESSIFASPPWRRQDSGSDSGPSTMSEGTKSPGAFDVYTAPSLHVLSASYCPSSTLPPVFADSPPAADQ